MIIIKRFPWLIPLFPLLWLLSHLFELIIYLRYKLYEWGVFKIEQVPVPVISVGSIEVGGSGKTPLVIYLAEKLTERGFKVAILSRGYKRKAFGLAKVSLLRKWRVFGDEPTLIKKRVEDADIFVSRNRLRAARFALEKSDYDLFLLDDGAQYLKLKKDVEIMVLRGRSHHCLPLGELRDGYYRLKNTDIILWRKKEWRAGI